MDGACPDREQGAVFMPKFDGRPADSRGGFAQEGQFDGGLHGPGALDKTVETGFAHFHSRSAGGSG